VRRVRGRCVARSMYVTFKDSDRESLRGRHVIEQLGNDPTCIGLPLLDLGAADAPVVVELDEVSVPRAQVAS